MITRSMFTALKSFQLLVHIGCIFNQYDIVWLATM